MTLDNREKTSCSSSNDSHLFNRSLDNEDAEGGVIMIDIFDADDEGDKCGDDDNDYMMMMEVATSYRKKGDTHFKDGS